MGHSSIIGKVSLLFVIGVIGYSAFKVYQEDKQKEEDYQRNHLVNINKINSLTYNIDLGDGDANVLLQKNGNTLMLKGTNIHYVELRNDTISVIAKQKNNISHHYRIAYKDYFSDIVYDKNHIYCVAN